MKGRLIWLIPALMLVLPSCSLLPTEEERPAPPIINDYTGETYSYAEVTRGNVVDVLSVTGRYSPAVAEELSFGESDIAISAVYVELGSQVKAGDMLAELNRSDILAELETVETELELLELELQYNADKIMREYEKYINSAK